MDNLHAYLARNLTKIKARLNGERSRRVLYRPITDERLKQYNLNQKEQIERILSHLSNSHKTPSYKNNPKVFLAVHDVNWERNGLVNGWHKIADIIHYDWGDRYDQYAPGWQQKDKALFNKELFNKVLKAHQETPLDLFFSYLSGRWVYPETVRAIGDLGIITVNISFDDKIKFWGYPERGGLSGNAEIAKYFDLCITSQDPQDIAKYIYAGSNPLYLPPAASPFELPGVEVVKQATFIGQRYGKRQAMIESLINERLPVHTYGKGWPDGEASFEDKIKIQAGSLINIGFGYIDEEEIVGLKGRDFETPLAGNLYLTTYNPALEECFLIGEEIDCYHNPVELADKIKYYLSNPMLAREIGQKGRGRCLRDHTWEVRFSTLLQILGFFPHP